MKKIVLLVVLLSFPQSYGQDELEEQAIMDLHAEDEDGSCGKGFKDRREIILKITLEILSSMEQKIRRLDAQQIDQLRNVTEETIWKKCDGHDVSCPMEYYAFSVEQLQDKACGIECALFMNLISVHGDMVEKCASKFPFPSNDMKSFQHLFQQ